MRKKPGLDFGLGILLYSITITEHPRVQKRPSTYLVLEESYFIILSWLVSPVTALASSQSNVLNATMVNTSGFMSLFAPLGRKFGPLAQGAKETSPKEFPLRCGRLSWAFSRPSSSSRPSQLRNHLVNNHTLDVCLYHRLRSLIRFLCILINC